MEYKQLESQIDLNDPEDGFSFSSVGDFVNLTLVDWRNRRLTFRFHSVYVFVYCVSNRLKSYPEATLIEVLDSKRIRKLRDDHSAAPDEKLHHYVISTNEDEWCEVVAEKYDLEEENKG